MRDLVRVLILVGLTGAAGPARAGGKCDTSTDEAATALAEKLTGIDQKQHHCVRRSETFPGLIRAGSFAYDRGCRWTSLIYNCELDPKDAAQRAQAAAGWAKTNLEARQKLALAWVTEVQGANVLTSQPERWGKAAQTFAPPHATATPEGGLVLRFWSQDPVGMRPVFTYRLREVRFSKEGVPGESKEVDSLSVDLK